MELKMKKRTIILLTALFSVAINIEAQQTVPASGGEAGGAGGSSSFTVGQTHCLKLKHSYLSIGRILK